MYAPTPLPKPVTALEVAVARERGLEWMMQNFDGGLFLYEFDPEIADVPNTSNALRQLMASRVVASESATDARFTAIHASNLDYVLAEWYQEDAGGGYVLYKDKSKLGANALLLRTLVYSPNYTEYEDEARQLARGIATLQKDDGSFAAWYVAPDYEYDEEYLLHFYSGEAILALVEYYKKSGDETALVTATRAAAYYLHTYVDQIEENYHPAYVPWHTMSYYHLFRLTGDERYRTAIYVLNDRLLELLDTSVVPGRFYKRALEAEGQAAPHSSSDAVYLEGLLYAYETAMLDGDTERMERYQPAIELATTRLVRLQYAQPNPDFAAGAETYLGAIPIRETNPRIRVDTTQHALDAFEQYVRLFGEEL